MDLAHDAPKRAGRRRPEAEALERKELPSADFPNLFTLVNDHAGTATIALDVQASSPEQVVFTVGGGTAVPGVDYTPVRQTLTVQPGQATATVGVPVLPADPSLGTRSLQLQLSPTPDDPAGGVAYLLIAHGADTTSPTVVGSKVLAQGANVRAFVVAFSKDMAPGPVSDVHNYEIDDPRSLYRPKGVEAVVARREIRLKSAVYDPATRSVTLTPVGKVPKGLLFTIENRELGQELKLLGQKTPPTPAQLLPQVSPITDASGNPLDGLGTGQPDGDLYTLASGSSSGQKAIGQIKKIASL